MADRDLLDTMRTNGSVRAFRPEPVSDAALWRILDAARFAPNGGNRQAWRVISVRDRATRAEIDRLSKGVWNEYLALMEAGVRPFAADASGHWPGPPAGVDLAHERTVDRPWMFGPFVDVPALLVIAADLRELAAMDCELDRVGMVAGGSIYPFAQNILLAARTEGLAGVLTTFLAREEPAAKQLLGLPDGFAIAALIVLGVPEHQATKLKRRPVAEFATTDRFDGPPLTGG